MYCTQRSLFPHSAVFFLPFSPAEQPRNGAAAQAAGQLDERLEPKGKAIPHEQAYRHNQQIAHASRGQAGQQPPANKK